MGYVKHEAIIVTGFNVTHVHLAHRLAKQIFAGAKQVSSVVHSQVNAYYSFLIGPDGSKWGWADDKIGNVRRSAFREWCVEAANAEKPMYLDVVELRYGGEDSGAEVLHTDGDLG